MDAFERELIRRSPLAACVLETCDYMLDDALLDSVWEDHRGRCYEDVLKFPDFLRLMRDALIRYGGSAHALYRELEGRQDQPVDESNFYRKLGRMPVAVSRALLRQCTARLEALLPGPGACLPACFAEFDVILCDGKKIKNAAKRLAPTRAFAGKLLGATALVAVRARSGMAIALNDSLDGMTNDVPLVPGLMEQLRALIPGPILSVWDRQFDDVRTLKRLSQRSGDAFVARTKQDQRPFAVESAVDSTDAQGRRVRDEIGVLGTGQRSLRVRRVTLFRGRDEEDVVLLSNLLDRERFSAADLLELYRRRWGIEQVFQQVTETFSLSHLIGSKPQGTLFQFAFCLLLYNLMQVIRAYLAQDGRVLASAVSMYYLFQDVRDELRAWAYHGSGQWPRSGRDAAALRIRLRELLKGMWDPILYAKAADKKPRAKPGAKLRLHGGYSSVQRALEGRAKVVGAR